MYHHGLIYVGLCAGFCRSRTECDRSVIEGKADVACPLLQTAV